MYAFVHRVTNKLRRDRALPLGTIARKGVNFIVGVVLAPWHLRQVTQVGRGVRTLKRPTIDNQGEMHIGDATLLRSINVPVELATAPGACLRIGAHCSINYGASIGATGKIAIGDRVRIGPYVMIVDNAFHDALDRSKRPVPQPVTIDDDVWIGAKATILPGVHLGRGVIVGTGAIVTRSVEPFCVVAGVPAKMVRKLDPKHFKPERPA